MTRMMNGNCFLNKEAKRHSKWVGILGSIFLLCLMCIGEVTMTFRTFCLTVYAYFHHDDGKAVPEIREISEINGSLTDEQFAKMRKHSEFGADFISAEKIQTALPFLHDITEEEVVYVKSFLIKHHYDAQDVSNPAIHALMTVDQVQALKGKRSYKPGFSFKKTAKCLEENLKKGKLDARNLKIFVSLLSIFTLFIIRLNINFNEETPKTIGA